MHHFALPISRRQVTTTNARSEEDGPSRSTPPLIRWRINDRGTRMSETERRPLLAGLAAIATGTTLAVGWLSWPVHTDLDSVAFENWRAEAVDLDVTLAANGVRVHRSAVELPPEGRAVLPCAWPRPALSYRLAVRPPWSDRWHAASFRGEGLHCSVVKLRPPNAASEPVDFEYTVPCPPNTPRPESCE
jgi:hypothetical protein